MHNQLIKNTVLLSSAYLGPVQYFTKLLSYPVICIEKEENYHKQSYRNRCVILAANGPLVLSIPVVDGPGAKAPMKELELSYDHHWQRLHWRSIVSAYNNSPFFEYYADDLAPFFREKKWRFLIDFNTEIQQKVAELLNLDLKINYSEEYVAEKNVSENIDDYRYSIHPKASKNIADQHFEPQQYMQVFQEKFGFVGNLSILDLLFDEGPGASGILRSCIK
jgi:hypothetical protein